MFGGHLVEGPNKERMLVNKIFSAEGGSMLLETLISATILMVTIVTVISFMHRALKGAQIQRRLLEPSCEHQLCSDGGDSSLCTCGNNISRVLR